MSKQIHIHVHTGDSADPKIESAKREAVAAIETAVQKCAYLKNALKDSEDRSQVQGVIADLKHSLGKIEQEVLSA
jgi:hypothetical protein